MAKEGRKPANETKGGIDSFAVVTPEHKKAAEMFLNVALEHGLNQYDNDEIKIFRRIAPIIASLDRLKDDYLDIIVLYCSLLSRIRRHTAELDKDGWYFVAEGRNGVQYKAHPLAAVVANDTAKFKQIADSLGLSPKSAKSVGSADDSAPTDDFDF